MENAPYGRPAPAQPYLKPAGAGSRRPGSGKTRADILHAARRLFAHRSFEHVSLREIGAEARADPALVARYFGGKERLFAAALAASQASDDTLSGDSASFPDRAAQAAVLGQWRSTGFEGLLLALRSGASPEVSETLVRPFEQRFVQRLAEHIEGEQPTVRAHLAFARIVGTAILHGMRSPGDAACSPDQARTIADHFIRELSETMSPRG